MASKSRSSFDSRDKRNETETKMKWTVDLKTPRRLQVTQTIREYQSAENCNLVISESNIWETSLNTLHATKDQLGDLGLFNHLSQRLKALSKGTDDIVVIELIQSFYIAYNITEEITLKDTRRALEKFSDILPSLHLKHPNTIQAYLCSCLGPFYLAKRKLGRAYKCSRQALDSIKDEAPSCWTAHVYYRQGCMYDMFSQVHYLSRRSLSDQAIHFFQLCQDHALCGDYPDWERSFWSVSNIIQVILDLPTLETLMYHPDSNILHDRLQYCNINQNDLVKAQSHLDYMKSNINKIEEAYREGIKEYIVINDIFFKIRQSQLHMRSEGYKIASEARMIYTHWESDYASWEYSRYNEVVNLHNDLNKVLMSLIISCPGKFYHKMQEEDSSMGERLSVETDINSTESLNEGFELTSDSCINSHESDVCCI